jgi:hypothetical protein
MNTKTNNKQPSIEDGVNHILSEAKHRICEKCESCEARVRESPRKAVLVAVAAGYCMHRLPVRSLLASTVRLAGALAPPALFAFGAAKLAEYLQNQSRVPKAAPQDSTPAAGI